MPPPRRAGDGTSLPGLHYILEKSVLADWSPRPSPADSTGVGCHVLRGLPGGRVAGNVCARVRGQIQPTASENTASVGEPRGMRLPTTRVRRRTPRSRRDYSPGDVLILGLRGPEPGTQTHPEHLPVGTMT